MNIAEVCIKKPTVTVSLAVALLLAGILGYFNLGRLEDPTLGSPALTAQNTADIHGLPEYCPSASRTRKPLRQSKKMHPKTRR